MPHRELILDRQCRFEQWVCARAKGEHAIRRLDKAVRGLDAIGRQRQPTTILHGHAHESRAACDHPVSESRGDDC